MLNPSLALLLSIAVILVLVRLKVPIALCVLAGSIFLILFVIPFPDVPSLLFSTLKDSQTWQLLIVVPSTLAFSSLMEQKGMLKRFAAALEGLGPKLAVHIVPAVIGLVSMPAGALVAATAVKSLAERLRLTPERITFINYWFRHVWEFSLPLYPGIIITSTVLAIPIPTTMRILLPVTGVAVILGAIVSYKMMRKIPAAGGKSGEPFKNIASTVLKAAWPIFLLIILIFAKVPPWIAFPVILLMVAIQQRVKWPEIKKALKYGLNPMILLLLLAVMLYQMTTKETNAAATLVSKMQSIGLPSLLMLVGLPLVIGLALGYGPAITGIAMPLLLPYIITSSGLQSPALIVAYVSGMVGQMLSPAHLCFCLSVEYFKTTLGKVYRYTVPILIVMQALTIAVFLLVK